MAKIKLTKGELKKQRDALKQFQHYLPTLQLKKQQLQTKIQEARTLLKEKDAALQASLSAIEAWQGLLGDPGIDLTEWVTPLSIKSEIVNVAGAPVPFFKSITFKPADYDLYSTPFWLDKGIEELRAMMTLQAEVLIVQQQVDILQHELRVTTQRVNLFEKVKIPECRNNIRVIQIYLGDQQAGAVGIGKVAKKKIEQRNLAAV